MTNFNYFPVGNNPLNDPPQIQEMPETFDHFPIVPPWERDDWRSKMTQENIEHLHKVLRHPTSSSLIELFRQQREGRKVPKTIKEKISEHQQDCDPCAEHPELPRKPKIAMPHPATPNIAVTLDVVSDTIRNVEVKFLCMLDAGDMQLRLSHLKDASARNAFNTYLFAWISKFDAPIFTIVDRGSNLQNEYMATNLRELDSQLCPIPTEAPWSIGNNERSHKSIHQTVKKLMSTCNFDPGDNYERLTAEVEMAWNFTQHINRTIPHFNRFGVMPRCLGELDNSQTVQQRIALQEVARQETARLRAERVLSKALNPYHRHVTNLTLFNVGPAVWFYRKKMGWRKGTVARIDRPTIYVELNSKFYPTHENRVRPHFGDISLPPEIRDNDTDELELMETLDDTTRQVLQTPPAQQQFTRAPVSDLLNTVFLCSAIPKHPKHVIHTDDKSLVLHTNTSDAGIIDSDELFLIDIDLISFDDDNNDSPVFLTSAEPVKNLRKLPKDQQEAFKQTKIEEVKFLLSEKAVEPILEAQVEPECEIQPMKWVLFIKRYPNSDPPIRYRSRLDSASHLTELRHSLNGNAPTIALSTLFTLLALIPTWNEQLKMQGDSISIRVRDVTKAYLQSMPTKRLVYYRPPPEFYQVSPQHKELVWKARVQVYGDVEAGKYWNNTLVPWMCNNILDYKQSIYDPSLLYSETQPAATVLCTDDTLSAMPSSKIDEEAKITQRFKCRDAQAPPVDFKGLDVLNDGNDIIASQNAYLVKVELRTDLDNATKPELEREMTTDEISQLRSDAGKLAWVSTGTSPLSSFHSRVALQRNIFKQTPSAKLLLNTRQVLRTAQEQETCQLRYVPLHEPTKYIRVYSDGAFQNLETKHSQIGFIIALADKDDRFNVVHWHSSRALRRAHSTEQSELMALDVFLRCINNLRIIIFQLLKKEVPIVAYIDNESLWKNLPNATVPTITEVGYRCREHLYSGMISSVALISGDINPADAMTKAKPNNMLAEALRTNRCATPAKLVFMAQDCKYRDIEWIPRYKVPMPSDHRPCFHPASPVTIPTFNTPQHPTIHHVPHPSRKTTF